LVEARIVPGVLLPHEAK